MELQAQFERGEPPGPGTEMVEFATRIRDILRSDIQRFGPLRPLTGGARFRTLADRYGVPEWVFSEVAEAAGWWPGRDGVAAAVRGRSPRARRRRWERLMGTERRAGVALTRDGLPAEPGGGDDDD